MFLKWRPVLQRIPCTVVRTSSSSSEASNSILLHRVRKGPAPIQISKRNGVRLVAALLVMSDISCHWQQPSSQSCAPPFIVSWLLPILVHRRRLRPCFAAPSFSLVRGRAALQQHIYTNVCRRHRNLSFPSRAYRVLVLGSTATRCFRRNACERRYQWTCRTNAAYRRRSSSKHTDGFRHGKDAEACVWTYNARRR